MVRICILVFRILFEWFKFSFEWIPFEWSELDLNASNPFGMIKIWIRMLRIGIRLLWMPVEWYDCIRMLRIPFEWFEFTFKINASNPFWMVRIGFESFESLSNLHSNAFNAFKVVRNCIQMFPICIRMLWMPVEWLNFAFECFDPFQMARIWIWMVWIAFEFAFECFKCLSNG